MIAFNSLGWDEETSTQALISEFRSQRSGNEALVFFGKMPLSGSFYTQGRAKVAVTADDLGARLDEGPVYVAIKLKHLERVPAEMLRGFSQSAGAGTICSTSLLPTRAMISCSELFCR